MSLRKKYHMKFINNYSSNNQSKICQKFKNKDINKYSRIRKMFTTTLVSNYYNKSIHLRGLLDLIMNFKVNRNRFLFHLSNKIKVMMAKRCLVQVVKYVKIRKVNKALLKRFKK